MRLFYGVELTDDIRNRLAQTQKHLRERGVEAGNWSDKSLFHITLLFLGELDESYRPKLELLGNDAALAGRPFQLTLSRPGFFDRNKILWYGLNHDEGYRQLGVLYQELRNGAKEFFPGELESRPYKAHITLARKLRPEAFPILKDIENGSAKEANPFLHEGEEHRDTLLVPHICLFASTRIDGRLQYPVLSRFTFPSD